MKRAVLIITSVLALDFALPAQVVPGQYIVELQGDPAVRFSTSRQIRYSTLDPQTVARRAEIRAEHDPIEQAVVARGGRVLVHYDTILNGMAVSIPDAAATQLRALPGVRAVTPVRKIYKVLDAAVRVQRIVDTWNALNGGQPSAGAGVKIGILDTGIDIAHPGFQGFTTPIPHGFPIACDYAVDGSGNIGSTCASNPAELANTNNKVIVSRDYTGDGGGDNDGHGSGVAMITAGLTNNAVFDVILSDGVTILPIVINPITGVAPGAWLGSYKVVGSNGGTIAGALLAAEDAVNDGMQVLNLSIGSASINAEDEIGGPVPRAISAAVAAGVVVVIAAGNDGFSAFGSQQPTTIDYPAVAADAITVGAIGNGRLFDYSVTVSGLAPVEAGLPDISQDLNFPDLIDPFKGPLVDVATIAPSTVMINGQPHQVGLACGALPNNSLNQQIALIYRGTCAFDTKLNNAMNAGAIGAIVIDNLPDEIIAMGLSSATLPALFVSQADGLNMQTAAGAGGATAYLDFGAITAFPSNPQTIAYYSSSGPTQAGNIKPDLMAVGGQPINWVNDPAMFADFGTDYPTGSQVLTAFSTAAAAIDGLTDAYQIASGTSFASPFVTGSVAVLMAARPGLTPVQYKSLVVNSAPQLVVCDDFSPPDGGVCFDGTTPLAPLIQNVGTGSLDLYGAFQNNLTATPVSINFQTASGSTVNSTIPVTVTNVGSSADTFSVAVNPLDGNLTPAVDTSTFHLAPGQTHTINVTMASNNLQPGWYHDGNVVITGTQTPVATNLAYWFGVPGTDIYTINLLNQNQLNGGAAPRQTVAILVRYTDVIGMPITGPAPTVTVPGTSGRVLNITPSGDIPGTWEIDVKLDNGFAQGGDEFDITVGNLQAPLAVFIPIFSN
jgi:subtilisin family serine protease